MGTSAYEELVPSFHRGQPKLMEYLRLILNQSADMEALLAAFGDAFDLDTAVGVQLDVIGEWVQASRILPFAPVSSVRRLSDDDYRLLIRAAIARNAWDGTNESLAGIFASVFPAFGITLEDKQDMSINVVIRGSFTELQVEMVNAGLLIPHPAGVTMTYEIPETIISTDIIVQAGVYQAGKIAFHSRSGAILKEGT